MAVTSKEQARTRCRTHRTERTHLQSSGKLRDPYTPKRFPCCLLSLGRRALPVRAESTLKSVRASLLQTLARWKSKGCISAHSILLRSFQYGVWTVDGISDTSDTKCFQRTKLVFFLGLPSWLKTDTGTNSLSFAWLNNFAWTINIFSWLIGQLKSRCTSQQ
jgi:hypothetical protein